MSTVLNFGKYRDQQIGSVYATDRGYCRWLRGQTELMSKFPDAKSFLDSMFEGDDGSYMMNWGKYKNKSIEWINNNDPKYITWLQTNEYVRDNCKKLKEALSLLI
jgi:hypothetical protein